MLLQESIGHFIELLSNYILTDFLIIKYKNIKFIPKMTKNTEIFVPNITATVFALNTQVFKKFIYLHHYIRDKKPT